MDDWGEREVATCRRPLDGHRPYGASDAEDWEGYPARKDYPVQITMKPKVYEPIQPTAEEFARNMKAERERARRD